MKNFKYLDLIEKIKSDFKIDYYGDHGIDHWRKVYANTQTFSKHYKIESEVFELFTLLHDRVVQICFDSDRLDIGRVGYDINTSYLATDYANSLVLNGIYIDPNLTL